MGDNAATVDLVRGNLPVLLPGVFVATRIRCFMKNISSFSFSGSSDWTTAIMTVERVQRGVGFSRDKV